ncbi:hypothetical protein AX14_004912 [Amanita brunnescens Koide BX004]|nr:hypothetical protein AX14_004912 [Amanita brunnescens Koide BX004]
MSSPRDPQEDAGERVSRDDPEEPQPGTDAGDETSPQETQPVKRRRGRPPGSKNKEVVAEPSAPAAAPSTSGPRKRGRPRKSIITDKENQPRPEDTGEEPPVKRSRGRPRKNPQPPTESAEAEGSEAPPKKKRGRPKKTTT